MWSQEEPKEIPMGFKLIGEPAMENGTFEPDETAVAQRIFE